MSKLSDTWPLPRGSGGGKKLLTLERVGESGGVIVKSAMT
jgi:hypothetical protein